MVLWQYSEEFKYSIVRRMMPPQNESVNTIARETGLSEATLYQWKITEGIIQRVYN
ncbi:transposase [Paenibacillus sp. MER TA 81-3]|uniref:transposase n=1 Tax=Paenibacillus TaxID=44249 RepID=UPI0034D9857A